VLLCLPDCFSERRIDREIESIAMALMTTLNTPETTMTLRFSIQALSNIITSNAQLQVQLWPEFHDSLLP
jgi:hypothetical protein